MEAQNNVPLLNRKEWQTMMPPIVTTAAGSFVAADQAELANYSLFMVSGTVHYLYDHANDDWLPITSGAFAGTFVAGAWCLSSVVSYVYRNRWHYDISRC